MKRLFQEKWRKYKNVTNCLICAKPFKSTDKKVYCHDHLTGEYRGPAHNARSELELPQKVKVPCIIHHLKGILFVYYSYFHNFQSLKLLLITIFKILILIAIFYFILQICSYFISFLQIKVLFSVTIFLSIFCIVFIYVAILRSGYDAHLIVSAAKLRHGKINVIPLHVLYYQQRLVYRLASIYVVLPQ